MFHSQTPFLKKKEENAKTVREECARRNIILPDNPHFLTHMNECNTFAIKEAFETWDNTPGVHSLQVTAGNAVTRLHGVRMGGADLSEERRVMVNRGADRPPQPVVLRDKPFQDTDLITLVIFPNNEGHLVLWTAHAGPSMPPSFEADEWKSSALAYRADEI